MHLALTHKYLKLSTHGLSFCGNTLTPPQNKWTVSPSTPLREHRLLRAELKPVEWTLLHYSAYKSGCVKEGWYTLSLAAVSAALVRECSYNRPHNDAFYMYMLIVPRTILNPAVITYVWK